MPEELINMKKIFNYIKIGNKRMKLKKHGIIKFNTIQVLGNKLYLDGKKVFLIEDKHEHTTINQ